MAVETYVPLNEATGYRRRPIDEHGKLRYVYAKTVVAVQGDANSLFGMGKLPPGVVRVMPKQSVVRCTAFGASRTLDIGHLAYRAKQDGAVYNDGIETGDADAFVDGMDISAAGVFVPTVPAIAKFDIYSTAGVSIQGIVLGGTSPVNAELETLIAYLYE